MCTEPGYKMSMLGGDTSRTLKCKLLSRQFNDNLYLNLPKLIISFMVFGILIRSGNRYIIIVEYRNLLSFIKEPNNEQEPFFLSRRIFNRFSLGPAL